MFRAHVLIIRRSKLHYTASSIITPIGGRLMHETVTYKFDDTRGCIMQFWPPDDGHMCSKHVEAWNKLIVKQTFCASSWLITEINLLRSTVSKTSTFVMQIYIVFDACVETESYVLQTNSFQWKPRYSRKVLCVSKESVLIYLPIVTNLYHLKWMLKSCEVWCLTKIPPTETEMHLKIYFSSPSKVPLVIVWSPANIHLVHRMRVKCEIWSLQECRRMETELQKKTYFVPQVKWL